MRRWHRCQIASVGTVVALVRKRLSGHPGEGVGETVSRVQGCWMPALSKSPPGKARRLQAFGSDGSWSDFGDFQDRGQLVIGLDAALLSTTIDVSITFAADMLHVAAVRIASSRCAASGSRIRIASKAKLSTIIRAAPGRHRATRRDQCRPILAP